MKISVEEKMTNQLLNAADESFEKLLQCSDELRNQEIPIFDIDGSNEKNSAALEFLRTYNFVVIDQSQSSDFSKNCALLKPVEFSGHSAFAFLYQKRSKTESFYNTAEPQLNDLLETEIADFIPDATAHCQAAWNLRCDKNLRQFFSAVYGDPTCVDQLLPSIESIMDCNASDSSMPFSLPTLNYNPTWSRAPHVISAYHLHAHYTALQAYYSEYLEHVQSKKEFNPLESSRNKQRWLHRLQKELISTAKKVILGKRATNQMVQDAAFHSKKETSGEKESSIEAMRPLQAGYEAFILTSASEDSIDMNLVPGFDNYYPYYLACRRNKWCNVGADCVVIPADDEYSQTIFDCCSINVKLKPGMTLIMSRTTPRWIGEKKKCTFLPLSYRWQKYGATVQDEDPICNNNTVVEFAQICPFELALNATYQKSINDGIVYTSIPHLTGAAQQFSRSTKKTSHSLKIQRQQIYNSWLATLTKRNDRNLAQYHYTPPQIAPFLVDLMEKETLLLKKACKSLKMITELVLQEEKEAEESSKIVPDVKRDHSMKKRKRDNDVETPIESLVSKYKTNSENCFADCEMLIPSGSIFDNQSNEPYDELQMFMQEFGGNE